MIKNLIFNKIKKNGSIHILGRGPSLKFFQSSKSKITLGINVQKVNNRNVDIFYNKKKLLPTKLRVKVGSVYFVLFEILYYLNKKLSNKKIKVFLYGFDFKKTNLDDDYQKKIIKKKKLQQEIDVKSQLIAYKKIKKSFTNLKIYRVGFDIESDHNPHQKKINNLKSKQLEPIEIVAELTTNHRGDTKTLKKLIEGCVKADIKAIKFQKRDIEKIYSLKKLNSEHITPISKTFREYREKLELTDHQINIIKKYQKKYNLKIIFSILDIKSYIYLKKKGFKYFKIPSTVSMHNQLLSYLSKEQLSEIIISTGMTNENYIRKIVKLYSKVKKLYLLHAISSYPTFYKTMNLNIIKKYANLSKTYKNILPGYSSHDSGNIGSMLAIAAGAKMIEKHVKLGDNTWMHYDDVALDVNEELPEFVNYLKKTVGIMGGEKKIIYSDEFHKYIPNKK